MSVAVKMIGSAPAPETCTAYVARCRQHPAGRIGREGIKTRTSPLVPGVNCVAAKPAGPLSSTPPLLLPSKPRPVTYLEQGFDIGFREVAAISGSHAIQRGLDRRCESGGR